MKTKQAKKIFDSIYGGPNPIFCYPQFYFEHNGYLCEVASAVKPKAYMQDSRWQYKLSMQPWHIFDLLFCDDGYWITVLKKEGDEYVKTNLSDHICDKSELRDFIKTKLN